MAEEDDAGWVVEEDDPGDSEASSGRSLSDAEREKLAGSLMRASDLLPPEDPPPSEPPDQDTPPDDAAPKFLIIRDAFGPGVPSVKLADGTPVGVYIDQFHHDATGAEITKLLKGMGLDQVYPGRSAWFGKQRDTRIREEAKAMKHPAMQKLIASEKRHNEQTEAVRAAYLKARRKEQK